MGKVVAKDNEAAPAASENRESRTVLLHEPPNIIKSFCADAALAISAASRTAGVDEDVADRRKNSKEDGLDRIRKSLREN